MEKSPAAKLTRTVLREQIKEVLIERILDGHYAPEDRLVESAIARELEVSQGAVREALRDLEAMRFVESAAYRGARVRRVTERELGEIYPVRAALEEVAGRAAAAKATEEVLDQMAQEIAYMDEAAESGNRLEQVKHDVRFHELIVEASGNRVLLEVWKSLRVEARTLVTSIKADANLRAIAEMHVPVLDSLRTRDPELAGRALREHIEHFGAVILGVGDPAALTDGTRKDPK